MWGFCKVLRDGFWGRWGLPEETKDGFGDIWGVLRDGSWGSAGRPQVYMGGRGPGLGQREMHRDVGGPRSWALGWCGRRRAHVLGSEGPFGVPSPTLRLSPRRRYIVFEGEEGQDAGGLLREWYMIISREMFNPMYALFRTSPGDRVTYTINPSSHCNPNHLSYFKFVGRIVAKAVYDNRLLECYFTRSFYKHILGKSVR